MSLNSGPYIILGGNGLGKTTIMQAVVFGLTGGAEEANEENKSFRWDHRYFRGRLNATQLHAATVEVDFAFGNTELTVRRSLKGPQVTGFRPGRSKKWIDDPDNQGEAQEAFDRVLKDLGGYQNTHDFTFIVHRLLYLPESRRLLAWDTSAQVRIFMMLKEETLWDDRLPDMILSYSVDMFMVLKELKRILRRGSFAWIVVSTSAYGGVEIPVDLVLADIAVRQGWKLNGVQVLRQLRSAGQQWSRLRKRSKPPLRESLVILERR